MRYFLFIIFLFFIGPIWIYLSGKADLKTDWRTAHRDSAGIAPPVTDTDAVVQVYAARAFNWRGLFTLHAWVAVKPANARAYTVYQVIGWRKYSGLSPLVVQEDIPDRYWFGHRPQLLVDIRGAKAATLIPKIQAAVAAYPYKDQYEAWPGPNSNTFVAYIGRSVPELKLNLPGDTIGRDYLGSGIHLGKTVSGTGWLLSLSGVLAVSIAIREGLQINILALVIGISPFDWSITLPGIGRIGVN